jgi:hypothetical protein
LVYSRLFGFSGWESKIEWLDRMRGEDLLGGFGMIRIKGLVFGDDFFELRFDAISILFLSKMDKFFDALVEPLLITMVSS